MKLCSNELYKFFMAIPDTMGSIEELAGRIAKTVPPICDMFDIGKIELCLNQPQSPYEECIKNNITMLYCFADGYMDKPVSTTYSTHSGGTAEVRLFPREAVVWNNDDLEALQFLSNIINMLCGKAGLAKLARISAVTDPATGIANAVGVSAFLSDCIARGTADAYTMLYLNIKNFSYLNQRLGPQSGDIILKKYAQRLKDFMRRDEICGRLNDDNYLAVIKNERIDKFLNFIEDVRLRLNIEDMVSTFSIQAKAGIYPIAKGDSIENVQYNISIAINAAKNSSSRDHVFFHPSMLDDLLHDKEISGSFSKAIALKEFDVYYQPKFDLNTGSLCGCEALVRWSKDGRLLSPSEFLPVLEKDGTICALDLYVLEEVCISLRAWLDAGLTPVRISTNFSKVHLHNRFLAEDIMNILNKYAIAPEYIEIELTESSGYEDFASLLDFISRIKNYGVYTSIDNFGTGYSSLKLISGLAIDIIKLDRSFAADIAASVSEGADTAPQVPKNQIVIKTIIDMAHELGIKVICEGVENNEQEALLRQLHCDMVQGFLYSKPLPHDEFQKSLQNTP